MDRNGPRRSSRNTTRVKNESQASSRPVTPTTSPAASAPKKRKVSNTKTVKNEETAPASSNARPQKRYRASEKPIKPTVKQEVADEPAELKAAPDSNAADALSASVPSLSDAEMYAFEGRSHWVGAHMSVSGGVENSILNARLYGCQAWALFLKPKMKWDCKPLTDDNIRLFQEWMPKFKYETNRCIPHGSYLVNLANPDTDKRKRSLYAFIDDLKRCAQLGIGLYNFHPGSGVNECTRQEACQYIADCINSSHSAFVDAKPGDELHGLECPVILLENMAGQGHQIGGMFQELADVIAAVKDKKKVGVCIDTAHAFASGMDITNKAGYEDMMTEFDRVVGLQYLKGMHLNDSASALGSHKDRHANLGGGHLGLIPFHCIMNDPRLRHMPLVLETPAASWRVWQGEIQALYSLQGLSPDDRPAWDALEAKLKALRAIEKEMEKGNSLAEGSKAARRALEGKPPPKKRNVKTELKQGKARKNKNVEAGPSDSARLTKVRSKKSRSPGD